MTLPSLCHTGILTLGYYRARDRLTGTLDVKRYRRKGTFAWLEADNPTFALIPLRGKPVVVSSNNDSCVIARSNEAKALGLKMGDPGTW